jgi:peptide-methionine (R)-S-oxide reductase
MARSDEEFAVTKSNIGWQMQLDESQYRVLRRGATEPAFSSDLVDEKREGTYRCAGCESDLFTAGDRYDSGTGWPSFKQPATPDTVGTRRDWKMIMPRTEVHCATCGGHLGHLFRDGPGPTGKRYCINGLSLEFEPVDE